MKMRRPLLLLLSIAMTFAVLAPSPAYAENAGDILTMAAAHDAARPVAWEVVRRNGSVNSLKIQGCHRRADNRAICLAVAGGSSSVLKTSCSIWVGVHLAHGRPEASLKKINCENERLALLRAADAWAAIRPVAESLGGPEVLIGFLGRQGRVEIDAVAGWFRPTAADPARKELCSARLQARLIDTGEVTVSAGATRCFTPS